MVEVTEPGDVQVNKKKTRKVYKMESTKVLRSWNVEIEDYSYTNSS